MRSAFRIAQLTTPFFRRLSANIVQNGRARRTFLMLTGGGTATSLSLSFFGGGGTAATKKEADEKSVVKEADAFYNQYMIDNAYGVLRRHRQSEDPEILWRLARVVYEQAKISANADEKKRLAAEALEFAKRALSHSSQSGSFGANKWYAITLNYASELGGSKEQLGKTLEVKRHLERAIELNPLDATTWMILGIWHFSFADLPSYMRLVAKAIYGTPPSSTYEEALRHFERAETVQPQFCSTNNFYLGRTYEALGRKDDAIKQYKAAFLAPMISVDDRDIHTKAMERLKKLGIDANKL